MLQLEESLQAWGTTHFSITCKTEIQQLDPCLLPLQQGLAQSSYVSDKPITATILKITDDENSIFVKAGIFFTGIIAGCSCADDPTPLDEQNEYCEILFIIDKQTARADIKLLSE